MTLKTPTPSGLVGKLRELVAKPPERLGRVAAASQRVEHVWKHLGDL